MKRLELSDTDVENLQVYLERLVCYEEDGYHEVGYKTNIIRDDILDLMRKIKEQTGVGLAEAPLPAAHTSTSTVPVPSSTICAHVTSERSQICQLCGVVVAG